MKILRFLAIFFLIFVSVFDLKSMKEEQQSPSPSSSRHRAMSVYVPADNKSSAPTTYFEKPVFQNTRPVNENYGTVPTAPSSKPGSSKPTDYADFSNLSGSEASQAPTPSSPLSSQGERNMRALPPQKTRPTSLYVPNVKSTVSSSASPLQQVGPSNVGETYMPAESTSATKESAKSSWLTIRPRAMTTSSHRNVPPRPSQDSNYGQMPPASSSSSSSLQQNTSKPTEYVDFTGLSKSQEGDQAKHQYAPKEEPLAPIEEIGSSSVSSQQYEASIPQHTDYGKLPSPNSYSISRQSSQDSNYGQMPPASSSSSSSLQQNTSKPTEYFDMSNLRLPEESLVPAIPSSADQTTQEASSEFITEMPSSSSSSSPTQQDKTPNYGLLPSATSYSQPSASSETSSSTSEVSPEASASSSSFSPEASSGLKSFRENLKTFLNLSILKENTSTQMLKEQLLRIKRWGCYGQLITYIESLPQFQDLNAGISKAVNLLLTDPKEIHKIVGQLRLIVSKFKPELSQEQISLKEFVTAAGAKSDEIDDYIQLGFMAFLFKDKEGLIKNPLKENMNQYFLLQINQTLKHQKIEDSKEWKKMSSHLQKSLSQIRKAYKAWDAQVKKLQDALQIVRNKINNPGRTQKELDILEKEKKDIINKLAELLEGRKIKR